MSPAIPYSILSVSTIRYFRITWYLDLALRDSISWLMRNGVGIHDELICQRLQLRSRFISYLSIATSIGKTMGLIKGIGLNLHLM